MKAPDLTFWDSIIWHLDLVAVQHGHAQKVSGSARSGYYKVGVIIAASVVEALAHKLLEKKLASIPSTDIPLNSCEWYDCHPLPKSHAAATGDLGICRKRQLLFQLKKGTDFQQINSMCLQLGIYSHFLHNKIDKVRIMRNRVHLQGQDGSFRKWNKDDLERVANALLPLLKMLNWFLKFTIYLVNQEDPFE